MAKISFWATECGNAFEFNDGGPKENGAKFCMYCGLRLAAARLGALARVKPVGEEVMEIFQGDRNV